MKKLFLLLVGIFAVVAFGLAWYYHLIPQKFYSNQTFGISLYVSGHDEDGDGVDDQLDLLESARAYVATKPKYKSKYYATGYPNDHYGVCTDVIGFAFLHAGYDLQQMVAKDIRENREVYGIDVIDKNIDFRRVLNLNVFFSRHATVLTNDITDIAEWQGGDIVVFPTHIAIVSDKRNRKGISYIIHNAGQPVYEEDSLSRYEVIGHYRFP